MNILKWQLCDHLWYMGVVAKKINVTIMKKVFGNLTNEKVDCVNKFHFTESIKCSEGSVQ